MTASPHRCSRCRQAVWFATNDATGNKMIIDDQTYPDGNIISVGGNAAGAVVHVLTKRELEAAAPALPGLETSPVFIQGLDLAEHPRYKDHHATCGKQGS